MDTQLIIRKMLGLNMEMITQEVAKIANIVSVNFSDISGRLKVSGSGSDDIVYKLSRPIDEIRRTCEENARSIDRLTRKVEHSIDRLRKVEHAFQALSISNTLMELKSA
jgi:hypothetical protein